MPWVEKAPGAGSWGEVPPNSSTRTFTNTLYTYARLLTDGYGLSFTAGTLGVDGYRHTSASTTTRTTTWGENAPHTATWTAV